MFIPSLSQIDSSKTSRTIVENPIVEVLSIEEENPYDSCIKTARLLGVNIPYLTDAEDIKHNTTLFENPQLVLFKYGEVYHVAVIEKIDNDGIHISEGNYYPGEPSKRIIDFNDPAIRGFAKY